MRSSTSAMFCVEVCLLCALWYTCSSTGQVLNKIILLDYPYPMTVAITSLLSISIYSVPLLKVWDVPRVRLSMSYNLRYIVPICIGKSIAISTSYMSLSKVPVSYANTVKASMPLFALFASRIILKERHSWTVYLSLLPIVAGITLATLTELSFNMMGLIFALVSTAVYALMNIMVKRVYRDTNMHPIMLMSLTAQIAAVILLPVWCLNDGYKIWKMSTDSTVPESSTHIRFFTMLCASGIISFVQNMLAFKLLHKLTSVSYAVANTTKRITVMTVSLVMLRNPVTVFNLCGMVMAIGGVFLYSRVKSSERRSSLALPTHHAMGTTSTAVSLNGTPEGTMSRVMTSSTLSDASLLTLEERLNRSNSYLATVPDEPLVSTSKRSETKNRRIRPHNVKYL